MMPFPAQVRPPLSGAGAPQSLRRNCWHWEEQSDQWLHSPQDPWTGQGVGQSTSSRLGPGHSAPPFPGGGELQTLWRLWVGRMLDPESEHSMMQAPVQEPQLDHPPSSANVSHVTASSLSPGLFA